MTIYGMIYNNDYAVWHCWKLKHRGF